MVQYLYITYIHPPLYQYFKSSLDYSKYLIQGKCYANSCEFDKFKFYFLELSGTFTDIFLLQVGWIHRYRICGYRGLTVL